MLNSILILIFFEIFEIFWQKGATFNEYFSSLLKAYKNGIIFFLCLHPSFYFVLIVFSFQSHFLLSLFIILFLKSSDLYFKIMLLDRFTKNKFLEEYEILFKTNMKLPIFIKILPTIFYIWLFSLAFS